MTKIILLAIMMFIFGGIILFFWQWKNGNLVPNPTNEMQNTANAINRVTKKPFGIYITPKNSPVSPEKFTGWHTGADFEIFPGEENKEIKVFAICDGKLLVKEFGRGYGGMAVESCSINNQPVTVVYGHLKLESIKSKIGEKLMAGSEIGILGQGNTKETDYERKHLHLGIHKGIKIDTRGYVATEAELKNWLNPLKP